MSRHEENKKLIKKEFDEITEEEKRLEREEAEQQDEDVEDEEVENEGTDGDEDSNEDSDDPDSDELGDETEEDESDDEELKDDEDSGEDSEEDPGTDDDGEDSEEPKGGEETDEKGGEGDSDGRRNLGPRQQDDSSDESDDEDGGSGSIKDKITDKATDKAAEAVGIDAEQLEKVQKMQDLASRKIAAGKSVLAGLKVAVTMLLNPIFWGLVVAVIIFIAIIALFSVGGKNDYNQMCDNGGVGSIMIDDNADDFTRQSAIASWLMSTPFEVLGGKPMTREQAMGVMGNLIEESQANPKTIQGGYANWETCDNDCVEAFEGGGKAVGILQWDGQIQPNGRPDPRRNNLVQLAREEGSQWYDLNVQLKHLKNELDGIGSHTYENYMLKKSGFIETGKSIEEYTLLWSEYIERCGTCRNDERVASAERFDSMFGGATASLSGQCIGGSSLVNTSILSELAKQIAYTREEKARQLGYGTCGGDLAGCGQSFSKPEYIEAKELVENLTGQDPIPGLLASCDRLVATMVRLSGLDESFPYGGAAAQIDYMDNSPNWERVSCQNRQPGDVFGRPSPGHIMIYVGEVDGRETVVSASLSHRSAHMSNISCSGDLFFGDNMATQGWRKVR